MAPIGAIALTLTPLKQLRDLQDLSKRMLFLEMLKNLDKLHILFYYFMQHFAFETHKFEFLE